MQQFMNQLLQGDSLEVLKTLPDNCVDSCVTDPPYGLSKEPNISEVLTKWLAGESYTRRGGGFMGKTWDSFVPSPALWREVYRVMKPGSYILCFSGTRTQDLMTVALRLAGFEIRDVIEWLYTSGFPKNMDVGKAFDKRSGAEREKVKIPFTGDALFRMGGQNTRPWMETALQQGFHEVAGNKPVTDLAKKWDGWGTALKPAHEPIILARKPLSGSVCDTLEVYGTGAINVDGCRIPTDDKLAEGMINDNMPERCKQQIEKSKEMGRFPANCVTEELEEWYSKYFNVTPQELSKKATKADRNSDWKGNLIHLEPRLTYSNAGCGVQNSKLQPNGTERTPIKYANFHPTVKPVGLIQWLIRLVTPPGGIVLDPFGGSGTTGAAARKEGRGFLLIEQNPEYVEIARARVG
ncbi:DNA-methyltransferase [Heliophilum fasciatum]|uniref:Methyltransferase n=1 Tax=Heliophilum fasciatum TaxID=35700 RepID=A0A4R2RL50_9FIRM|nr:DNA methyltransferase [Heliophilum fasciatum]MCW2279290.1 site-specific DNA-methyltransferase (adenine-specific) [Heliophilum fasciatum]TCP60451.1 site-specific DNA-methyltransferase (adenine-specific) [Heliophilum fasciatum]